MIVLQEKKTTPHTNGALPLQQLFSLLIHGNLWHLCTMGCTAAGDRTGDSRVLR